MVPTNEYCRQEKLKNGNHGSPIYRVSQKLNKVKLDLKSLSKSTFGDSKTTLKEY